MKAYSYLVVILFSFIFLNCKKRETPILNTDQDSRKERILNYKNIRDSINKELDWKELSCGLWRNKKGEIGFKTQEGTEEGIFIDRYITLLCCEEIPLVSVIDTLTFQYIGSSFYKDKNNIYNHYTMVDGGNLSIYKEADYQTFEVIGDCYAKDKNHIYGERAGILENIDYQSFRTGKNTGCFAKDKNGYYWWGEKIDMNDWEEEPESKKMIEELDRL